MLYELDLGEGKVLIEVFDKVYTENQIKALAAVFRLLVVKGCIDVKAFTLKASFEDFLFKNGIKMDEAFRFADVIKL